MTATAQHASRLEWKPYKCSACGHIQDISTNHNRPCFDFCLGCSWKSQAFRPDVSVQMFGWSYRRFKVVAV